MATQAQCERALDRFEERLSGLKNVVGLGVVETPRRAKGKGKDRAVAVYVSKKLPLEKLAAKDRVPAVLELPVKGEVVEVPTKVIEQGEMVLE